MTSRASALHCRAAAILATAVMMAGSAPALAQEIGPEESPPAFDVGAELTIDMVALARGGADSRARVLSNLSLFATADLGRLAGLNGMTGHIHVLDNRGARPNDASQSLQGINNIEVPAAGTRLFEAWVEQQLGGGASLLVGLYDVNSEFYVNDAADLLISPPFGIGSEFAATGPNGPSIFPSSALAARLALPFAGEAGTLRLAVINAHASTIGDGGGVDLDFDEGLLLVGEAGIEQGALRASIGGWLYTRKHDDLFVTDLGGVPLLRRSRGLFAVAEWMMPAGEERELTWFMRGGISDGRTSPFSGGAQAGFKLAPLLTQRPDGAFSLGVQFARTGNSERLALIDAGVARPANEHALSATYADQIAPWLGVQGEVQWLRNAGGDTAAAEQLVTTIRVVMAL